MKPLKNSGIKLTELEIKSLECILSQGSYYEEALDSNYPQTIEEMNSCFFGWEIDEEEVPGCRGALASLVKKGVIVVSKEDKYESYYTNYSFDFDKSKGYHKLAL